MPRFAPKVMDGTRGPRADRIDEIRARAEEAPDVAQGLAELPKVDGTIYMSAFPAYCVQITAPADVTDPLTGRKTIGRPVKALFTEGRYVNNAKDPRKVYDSVDKDGRPIKITMREWIDEALQKNSRFGRPGSGADYWLAEDAIRMTKAAAKASAKETLRKLAQQNPDELKQFLAELQQGDDADVKMPAAPAGPAA